MAEGIGQHGDPAIGRILGWGFEPGARRDGAFDGGVDVVDDDVGVDWRPVSAVAARIATGAHRAGILAQQVDRRRPTHELDEVGAEAAGNLEVEGRGVEAQGGFDVWHIDIEQQFHGDPQCRGPP